MAQCEICSLVLSLKSAARGPVIRKSALHWARNGPWWTASSRALRILLICVALDGGAVPLGPLPTVLISAATIIALQVPGVAEAQTSGGYSRPGGGSYSRGYAAPARRPSVSGGFGSGSTWGSDRSISRQTSSERFRTIAPLSNPPRRRTRHRADVHRAIRSARDGASRRRSAARTRRAWRAPTPRRLTAHPVRLPGSGARRCCGRC
jgi:hypothetical protein